MKSINNVLENRTIDLIGLYVDLLMLEYPTIDKKDLPWYHLVSESNPNPENIEVGISGILIFLMEYYAKYPSDKLLYVVDDAIERLTKYCEREATNDYGLFTGRSGFIYVLIDRYEIDQNQKFLDIAIELVVNCSEFFRYSNYTSNFLYDGKSGFLIVLLKLYELTLNSKIKKYINELFESIISEIRPSKTGVHWRNRDEYHLNSPCGFAYGSSGILYALKYIKKYCEDDLINQIFYQGEKHISNSWNAKVGNWLDYYIDNSCQSTIDHSKIAYSKDKNHFLNPSYSSTWSTGMSGLLIYYSLYENLGGLNSEKITLHNSNKKTGLKNGMPGTVLSYLLSFSDLDSEQLSKIVGLIDQSILTPPTGHTIRKGLLNGNLGSIYALLKLKSKNPYKNVLTPFYNEIKAKRKIPLAIEFPHCKLYFGILKNIFPKTFWLMCQVSPELPTNTKLWKKSFHGVLEFDRLKEILDNLISHKLFDQYRESISELIQIEKTKADIFHKDPINTFQKFIENECHKDNILSFLDLSNYELLELRLTMSKQITIIETKWDWSFVESVNYKINSIYDLLGSNKKDAFVILKHQAQYDEMDIYIKHDFCILLQSFDGKRNVGDVLNDLRKYINSLSETETAVLFNNLNIGKFRTDKEYQHFLQKVILITIRDWLYMGILEVSAD